MSQFQLVHLYMIHTSTYECHVENVKVQQYLLLACFWVQKTLASIHNLLFGVNELGLIYQAWSACHT